MTVSASQSCIARVSLAFIAASLAGCAPVAGPTTDGPGPTGAKADGEGTAEQPAVGTYEGAWRMLEIISASDDELRFNLGFGEATAAREEHVEGHSYVYQDEFDCILGLAAVSDGTIEVRERRQTASAPQPGCIAWTGNGAPLSDSYELIDEMSTGPSVDVTGEYRSDADEPLFLRAGNGGVWFGGRHEGFAERVGEGEYRYGYDFHGCGLDIRVEGDSVEIEEDREAGKEGCTYYYGSSGDIRGTYLYAAALADPEPKATRYTNLDWGVDIEVLDVSSDGIHIDFQSAPEGTAWHLGEDQYEYVEMEHGCIIDVQPLWRSRIGLRTRRQSGKQGCGAWLGNSASLDGVYTPLD